MPPSNHERESRLDTPRWRRYLRFWGPRVADDVDDELRFHIDMRAADLIAHGMSRDDARLAARASLGDVESVRRACLEIGNRRTRKMLRTQVIDALRQDVTFAARSLVRRAGWTPIVVLTLALGIGVSTAVFSIVDHVLLRPVPYPAPERVVMAGLEFKPPQTLIVSPRAEQVDIWRSEARTLETMEGIGARIVTWQLPGQPPEVLAAAEVTTTFADFAGVVPIHGRGFTAADGETGAEPVVILSQVSWRTHFGRARDVLGRQMTLDGVPHTIIGVYPASLRVPTNVHDRTDLWLPAQLKGASPTVGFAIGRMRPGVNTDAVVNELSGLLERLSDLENGKPSLFVARVYRPAASEGIRESIWMFAVAVALVMLIACANVAHMLLAQATSRERELAVRRALGAGRGRIIRLLVTETLLLSCLGCIAGAFVAWGGLELLMAFRPPVLSDLAAVSLNGRALAVAAGISVITGLVFGLISSSHALRRPAQEILKGSGSSLSGSRRHVRLRGGLVVSEIALSAMLLVGAILLLRTVWNLQNVDPGFDTTGVYGARIHVPFERYRGPAAARAFYDELIGRASALPGVEAVTVAQYAPPQNGVIFALLEAEDNIHPLPRPALMMTPVNHVRPDYFSVLRMRFVEGGPFSDTTYVGGEVVINQTAARTLWPEGSAVGRRFRTGLRENEQWRTVMGVIADEASTAGPGMDPTPMLYIPVSNPVPATLIVRARAGTDPVSAIRQLIVSADPLLPAARIASVKEVIDQRIARQRFTMMLLVTFAAMAVILSAVGLYGVMSYTVAQRTREIGIRVALGATRAEISRGVVASGLRWTLLGLVLGGVGAWWATRLTESMLFGVARTDPLSFGAGAGVLVAITIAACVVPARRAAGVDPIIAMRSE